MKILITGDNASTRFGGEAILPYHYFRLLNAQRHETWLVTHARCQQELEQILPDLTPKMAFIHDSILELVLFKMESFPLCKQIANWLRSFIFQIKQRNAVKTLVKQYKIDLVHQVIPVSPKLPSFLFNIGAPVLIGPMNGGMNYPPGFSHLSSKIDRFYTYFGRACSHIFNAFIPGKRKADLLLVANERTRSALPKGCQDRTKIFVENGIDSSQSHFKAPDKKSIRCGFLGHLVPLKGVQYLIEAYGHIQNPHVELHIFGDGVFRRQLEKIAGESKKKIYFHGMIDWKKVPEVLAELDLFVFPSLKDCGGAVLLEAMAAGLPILSTAWGGPLDYLDSTCAILVEPQNETQFIRELAQGIEKLAASEELRQLMGEAGKKKALEKFTWKAKIEGIIQIYRELCEKHSHSGST